MSQPTRILALALRTALREHVPARIDLEALEDGLERGLSAVRSALEAQARPVTTRRELAQLAAAAEPEDTALSELVAAAMARVGPRGSIAVETGPGSGSWMEVVAGTAVVHVGGPDPGARADRCDRFTRALELTRAAVAGGVVPEPGRALAGCLVPLERTAAICSGSQRLGVELFAHAIRQASPLLDAEGRLTPIRTLRRALEDAVELTSAALRRGEPPSAARST